MDYNVKLKSWENAVQALKCFCDALSILANISLSQAEVNLISERMKELIATEHIARSELIDYITPKSLINGKGI